MLSEILISLFFGILAGTITGLIPGIHINLIGALLISLTSLIYLNPLYAIVFISSMAIAHTFLDFIPSILLGCPDTDTELGILPGHQLLKNKKGYEAIQLSNIGSIISIPILLILILPSLILLKDFYTIIRNFIPYILIIISTFLILTEKRKIKSLKVFLLTGLLGVSTLNLQMNQPLLPLLTGLFGASNIIISIKNKTKIPPQKITKPKTKLKKPIISSLISAPFCSFLPAMGAGQAAIIGNTIIKNSKKQFLVLLGIINTLVMSFSFISLYLIEKTRTGAAKSINEILPRLEPKHIILIISVVIISGTISFFLTKNLAKYLSQKIGKINYKKISFITLIILFTITLLVSKLQGILILTISTLTGIYSIKQKVRRTNMMGCLIIPTIINYF